MLVACRRLLESGAVSPDVLVDRHYPTPALARTAEQGLFQFTEELLKRGAQVRLILTTLTHHTTHAMHLCINRLLRLVPKTRYLCLLPRATDTLTFYSSS